MQSALVLLKAEAETPLSVCRRVAHMPPWQMAGAYAKCYFQTLRHGVNSAFGMPARSACASMANGWPVIIIFM
jgi:hypothetical protein